LASSADRLAPHLSSSVEINQDGARKVYTATQAKFVLKKFFTQNVCTSFHIKNEGYSAGMYYVRADYRGNTSYWVSYFIKGTQLVKIKIESQ